MKLMYDIKDLIEVLPFGESKIRELVSEGNLPMWKVKGQWVISHNRLEKWVNESEIL